MKIEKKREVLKNGALIKIIHKTVPFWAYIIPEGQKIRVGVCDAQMIAPNQKKAALEWAAQNAGKYNPAELPAEIKRRVRQGYHPSNLAYINVGKKWKEWFNELKNFLKKEGF